jgi:peptidoglycan/LPS O-acetylase OafA/YrhL
MRHADIVIAGGNLASPTGAHAKVRVSAPSNFATIQALRAVAALLVVTYHAFDMWSARVDSAVAGAGWTNGAAGVDIFFVISGFVMVVSSQRLQLQPGAGRIFIQHRIVRIVPLYWLLTTAKLLVVFFFADLALRSSLDPDYVIGSYLFLPVTDSAGHFRPLLPVGWTLTYEFMFYLLFALALALRAELRRVIVPGLGLVVVAALLRSESWPAWTVLFSTIVIEFIFGVVLAKLTLRGWRMRHGAAVVLLIAGAALIVIVPEGSENLRTLTWGVPAFAIVAGAISLEDRIAMALPRWLLILGDASYSIYLTHGFVLPVLGLAVVSLRRTGMLAEALAIVAGVLAAAIVGVAVYAVIERPIISALKKRSALPA